MIKIVRSNRIKHYTFPTQQLSAASPGLSVHSENINGEILDLSYSFNQNGSVSLQTSGLGEEFFRDNSSSGASTQLATPRKFSQSTTGSIANALHVPFIANGPVILNTGSLVSGTSATLDVTIRYR